MTTASATLWRQLVRVVTPGRRFIKVVVPGYGSRRYLTYPRVIFPKGRGWQMRKGYRFHAFFELGAEGRKPMIMGPFEAGSARTPKPLDIEKK